MPEAMPAGFQVIAGMDRAVVAAVLAVAAVMGAMGVAAAKW